MRILVVEDNKSLADNIAEYLSLENYTVEVAYDGEQGYQMAISGMYSLLILDINLPHKSGLEICQDLRALNYTTPILILTARADIDDKIKGLDIGADDYMSKPFDLDELGARVRVQLRREGLARKNIVEIDNISINMKEKIVQKLGQTVALSPKEYAIFSYLVNSRGRVRNRTDILDHIWRDGGEDIDFASDTVEVHMSYIRKKLGKEVIKTRKGYGYIVE